VDEMGETFLLRDLPRYECLRQRSLRYPELDADAVEATLALMRVASDVLEAFGTHLERRGLSQSRFLALMLVERWSDAGRAISPSQIAEALDVSRASVTGLLDGLEGDGFIERRAAGGDRRALSIHLTPLGRQYLGDLLPDHYARTAGLMAHLDEGERKQLVLLLSKVAQGTHALRDEGWTPASVQEAPQVLTEDVEEEESP
jgi:DNA-binding MarR family transcriptional regulator